MKGWSHAQSPEVSRVPKRSRANSLHPLCCERLRLPFFCRSSSRMSDDSGGSPSSDYSFSSILEVSYQYQLEHPESSPPSPPNFASSSSISSYGCESLLEISTQRHYGDSTSDDDRRSPSDSERPSSVDQSDRGGRHRQRDQSQSDLHGDGEMDLYEPPERETADHDSVTPIVEPLPPLNLYGEYVQLSSPCGKIPNGNNVRFISNGSPCLAYRSR